MSNRFDVDLVIFDWDGTLVSSIPAIVDIFQQACDQHNLPKRDADFISQGIGLSFQEQLDRNFDGIEYDPKAFMATFYDIYRAMPMVDKHPLVPGAMDVLNHLRDQDITLAIATGMPRVGLDAVIAHYQLTNHFAFTVTADEAASKPSPDMIHQALAATDVAANRAMMIGDNDVDIIAATKADVAAIGVITGVQQSFEHSRPLAVLSSVADLPGFLARGEGVLG